MSNLNFQPIFDYLDNTFKPELKQEIKEELVSEFRSDFNRIYQLIDKVLQELTAMRTENSVAGHRISRLEN